jgi:hypothetical protein
MEQATKGNMGQPAACMIENNIFLQVLCPACDEFVAELSPMAHSGFHRDCPTELVDNFVDKRVVNPAQAPPGRPCDNLMNF